MHFLGYRIHVYYYYYYYYYSYFVCMFCLFFFRCVFMQFVNANCGLRELGQMLYVNVAAEAYRRDEEFSRRLLGVSQANK